MKRPIELSETNCDIDFAEYQLLGYRPANTAQKFEKFEDGFYGEIKGFYCVISTQDYKEYRNRGKNEYDLNINLLHFDNNKFVLSDEIIKVSTTEITPIPFMRIL